MCRLRTSSSPKSLSNKRINGPSAQDALLSLALPSNSAERPSTSRKFTSFPKVAPTILPADETIITTSGSGLFHLEIGCRPTSNPVPTADSTGDLVKISASGPMPTSRYCDQAPLACSISFSRMASGPPGLTLERSLPTSAVTSARKVLARAASPRACSSITRSIMLTAKVTPAALMACRSIGASSHGLAASRRPGGVLASSASSGPMAVPLAWVSAATGSGCSVRSRMVANVDVMSCSMPPRNATMLGPPSSGRKTRPARLARL